MPDSELFYGVEFTNNSQAVYKTLVVQHACRQDVRSTVCERRRDKRANALFHRTETKPPPQLITYFPSGVETSVPAGGVNSNIDAETGERV